MRFQDVITYEKARLRRPWVWMPVVGLGLLLTLSMWPLAGAFPKGFKIADWLSLAFGMFGVSGLVIWLSPAPWLFSNSRGTHATFFRGVIQSAVFGCVCIALIAAAQLLAVGLTGREMNPALVLRSMLAALIQLVPVAMLAGYFISLWERTRIIKEETEKKLREAHWVLLRGQLSPHALFNALNGLAELVHIDPTAAEKGILDLASLYRALLDHGSRPSAPLRDERVLVTRYLAVESMRLGQRLEVQWHWDERLDDVETPPFMVQPMVENAIKHGIAPSVNGGDLVISLAREGDDVVMRVTNAGKPLPLLLGNGVGVGNLEARLFLAYGEHARFRLWGENNRTFAEVRIAMSSLGRKS
ncbi:MAG: histidine kinase [Holophaga sp.]|nr:histidine kinase [Holophaga sp.]